VGSQRGELRASSGRCGSDRHRLLIHRFPLLLVRLAASAQGWSVTVRVFAKVRRSDEQTTGGSWALLPFAPIRSLHNVRLISFFCLPLVCLRFHFFVCGRGCARP